MSTQHSPPFRPVRSARRPNQDELFPSDWQSHLATINHNGNISRRNVPEETQQQQQQRFRLGSEELVRHAAAAGITPPPQPPSRAAATAGTTTHSRSRQNKRQELLEEEEQEQHAKLMAEWKNRLRREATALDFYFNNFNNENSENKEQLWYSPQQTERVAATSPTPNNNNNNNNNRSARRRLHHFEITPKRSVRPGAFSVRPTTQTPGSSSWARAMMQLPTGQSRATAENGAKEEAEEEYWDTDRAAAWVTMSPSPRPTRRVSSRSSPQHGEQQQQPHGAVLYDAFPPSTSPWRARGDATIAERASSVASMHRELHQTLGELHQQQEEEQGCFATPSPNRMGKPHNIDDAPSLAVVCPLCGQRCAEPSIFLDAHYDDCWEVRRRVERRIVAPINVSPVGPPHDMVGPSALAKTTFVTRSKPVASRNTKERKGEREGDETALLRLTLLLRQLTRDLVQHDMAFATPFRMALEEENGEQEEETRDAISAQELANATAVERRLTAVQALSKIAIDFSQEATGIAKQLLFFCPMGHSGDGDYDGCCCVHANSRIAESHHLVNLHAVVCWRILFFSADFEGATIGKPVELSKLFNAFVTDEARCGAISPALARRCEELLCRGRHSDANDGKSACGDVNGVLQRFLDRATISNLLKHCNSDLAKFVGSAQSSSSERIVVCRCEDGTPVAMNNTLLETFSCNFLVYFLTDEDRGAELDLL